MKKYITPSLHTVAFDLEESSVLCLSKLDINPEVGGNEQLTQGYSNNIWDNED